MSEVRALIQKYNAMTISDLKLEMKKYKLPTTGSKKDLLVALIKFLTTKKPTSIKDMTKEELITECKKKKIKCPTGATKEAIIKLLTAKGKREESEDEESEEESEVEESEEESEDEESEDEESEEESEDVSKASKKVSFSKPVAKKAASKKPVPKKAPAKKVASMAKKTSPKKAPAPAKKTSVVAKKPAPKKAPTKKTPVAPKKAPAKGSRLVDCEKKSCETGDCVYDGEYKCRNTKTGKSYYVSVKGRKIFGSAQNLKPIADKYGLTVYNASTGKPYGGSKTPVKKAAKKQTIRAEQKSKTMKKTVATKKSSPKKMSPKELKECKEGVRDTKTNLCTDLTAIVGKPVLIDPKTNQPVYSGPEDTLKQLQQILQKKYLFVKKYVMPDDESESEESEKAESESEEESEKAESESEEESEKAESESEEEESEKAESESEEESESESDEDYKKAESESEESEDESIPSSDDEISEGEEEYLKSGTPKASPKKPSPGPSPPKRDEDILMSVADSEKITRQNMYKLFEQCYV